jgi:branched-chain amino acid transport system ATP-binding protein
MTNPTLLLMDEPSEGLAPAIVQHLGEALRDLVSQGQRVLLIEQNLKFASSLCEEIVILANGQVQATVSSKELRENAELQNKYLGVA